MLGRSSAYLRDCPRGATLLVGGAVLPGDQTISKTRKEEHISYLLMLWNTVVSILCLA